MFESDDFDQILSQFVFPDVPANETANFTKDEGSDIQSKSIEQFPLKSKSPSNSNITSSPVSAPIIIQNKIETCTIETRQNNMNSENISPKHTKRKMINSFFDHNAKRKFPGPAGLLNGNFEESKDETICHMELFSQDVDLSDNYFGEKFDTEIWRRLTDDLQNYNLGAIDSIKSVKQQAVAGHLRRRKAQAVTAFVETVDRSATDPLITLRDTTGCIKCTLHRDAWSTFAPYIVSEYCALVLRRPTVLTTGSAFKKHYLNITLSNIHAIYSSAVLREDADSKPLPEEYHLECDDNVTVIRVQNTNLGCLIARCKAFKGRRRIYKILSQFVFPDVPANETANFTKDEGSDIQSKSIEQFPLKSKSPSNSNITSSPVSAPIIIQNKIETCTIETRQNNMNSENISPKHTKRKMINSFFDHNAKRKFPGPAGLLNGNFEESKDETICHMELFSQDVDLSDNYFGEKFDTEIWRRLTDDLQNYNLGAIDSIKSVKQQAVAGHLRRRKAQAVTAFVETVDRSATDPLITLRDTTGEKGNGCIKCTLHRDAWSTFAPYIVSEYCALVLRRPTVLTTGSAFKKHYLNITLSNIHAIYSSAVLREDADSKPLPEEYHLECDDNVTVIRVQNTNLDKGPFCNETSNDTSDLLDDLDNIFTDDLFSI